MNTNLYGERSSTGFPTPIVTGQEPLSTPTRNIVEVDMNESNLTLFQTIYRTRKIIDELPEDATVSIYFVSGFKGHNCHDFWNDYYQYLMTIPNLSRLNLIYRGYLHFQNLGLFFIGCPVILNENCKLIYDSVHLHEVMKILGKDKMIYQNFTSRFLGIYKNFTYIVSEDLNELKVLGFNFQTF